MLVPDSKPWVLIPVKSLDAGKMRLADVLSQQQRSGLIIAMLRDVLTAVSGCPDVGNVVVATRDRKIASLVAEFGSQVIYDRDGADYCAAVSVAAAQVSKIGGRAMIVIPGDVPLATAAEISEVAEAVSSARSIALVPAISDFGTNCLGATPPNAIPFRFGTASFEAHLSVARQAGITSTVLRLSGLGFDVDTPVDLERIMSVDRNTFTSRYLHETRFREVAVNGSETLEPTLRKV